MKRPAENYSVSTRRYDGPPDLTYPFRDRDIFVTASRRPATPPSARGCRPTKGQQLLALDHRPGWDRPLDRRVTQIPRLSIQGKFKAPDQAI
jgi:hypothetical protein